MFLHNPNQCPLCGGANECQLCTPAAYKGQCWCARMEMPAALLARVPENLRDRACICQHCVENFQSELPPAQNVACRELTGHIKRLIREAGEPAAIMAISLILVEMKLEAGE